MKTKEEIILELRKLLYDTAKIKVTNSGCEVERIFLDEAEAILKWHEQQHDQLAEKLFKAVESLIDEHYRNHVYPTNESIKQAIIKTLKG